MPGCVLHVLGQDFEPESILAGLSLEPYSVFRKGDKRFPENPRSEKTHNVGGFKCLVSSVDGDLAGEVTDCIDFLTRHYGDLAQLGAVSAIEDKCLDFGYECRLFGAGCWVQRDYLPAEMTRLCGALGLRIKLSLYPRWCESD